MGPDKVVLVLVDGIVVKLMLPLGIKNHQHNCLRNSFPVAHKAEEQMDCREFPHCQRTGKIMGTAALGGFSGEGSL